MKTSDIQNILSDMETLDELCDNYQDWERSAKVKRIVMVYPMALILRFSKKEKGNLNSQHCMCSSEKGRSSTRGLTVALTKIFCLDFEHTKIYKQHTKLSLSVS